MEDSKKIKEILGNRAKEIIADNLGLVEKNSKVKCPLHNDNNPSMSWFAKGLMWRCHSCNGQIDIYSYFMDFENMSFSEAVEEVKDLIGMKRKSISTNRIKFKTPKVETTELTKPFIDYMGKRKISKSTLDFWDVKQGKWNGQNVYVFNYYDENNKLVYVTYRGLGNKAIKGGCEPNTRPILWGINNIDKSKPLVITEGQPDAMAVWESGYKNVVSVPSGCNNFKWIDNTWDWLQEIKEIIVFADNDEPGIKMADTIKRKLKNVKILISDRKDANEVLYYDGKETLLKLIENKIKETPKGILDLSEVEYRGEYNTEDTIETGFYEYDSHVEDLKPEEITIVFGRNGEGKTTFVSQIIANCINNKVKVFLYSGEMSTDKIQNWIYRQMTGSNEEYLRIIKTKYRDKVEPKEQVIELIKNFHREIFYLYDRNEAEITGNLDKFFEILEIATKRYNVQLFVIDNLMSVLEENGDTLYSDQANFVQRIKNFSIKNKVHVILVAHPNKEKREIEGIKGNLQKTDISGSNNIANKADNIVAVERIWNRNEDEPDCIVTSLKDRQNGQRKVMKFYFSDETLRFYNDTTKEKMQYNWEKEYDDGFNILLEETNDSVPWK